MGAHKKLKNATGADILIHAADADMLEQISVASMAFGLSVENSPPADRTIGEGDQITFGNITFNVIHTPGHSPGGIALSSNGVVFVGDSLFYGSIGRTDFPGGDYNTLISSIKNKLFPLGDEVVVYTGHGPATTIGQEKRMNPFLK